MQRLFGGSDVFDRFPPVLVRDGENKGGAVVTDVAEKYSFTFITKRTA